MCPFHKQERTRCTICCCVFVGRGGQKWISTTYSGSPLLRKLSFCMSMQNLDRRTTLNQNASASYLFFFNESSCCFSSGLRCEGGRYWKARGARLWNEVKSSRLRPGSVLLLCRLPRGGVIGSGADTWCNQPLSPKPEGSVTRGQVCNVKKHIKQTNVDSQKCGPISRFPLNRCDSQMFVYWLSWDPEMFLRLSAGIDCFQQRSDSRTSNNWYRM